jgi:hypothetical protein
MDHEGATYKTLRDEIAIAALAGILQRDEAIISREELAKWCYAVADAMLAAREVE